MRVRAVIEFDVLEDLAEQLYENDTKTMMSITDELINMFESEHHGIAEYSSCLVQSVKVIDTE